MLGTSIPAGDGMPGVHRARSLHVAGGLLPRGGSQGTRGARGHTGGQPWHGALLWAWQCPGSFHTLSEAEPKPPKQTDRDVRDKVGFFSH